MSDYAPLYSKRERIRIALWLAALLLPFTLFLQYWLRPRVEAYARFANCQVYGDINGVHVLLYAIFTGAPLFMALLLLLLFGRRSMRLFRHRQDPLPGEKVLRKTRYRYGRAALRQPILLGFVIVLLAGFAIWGGFQVGELADSIAPCSPEQRQQMQQNAARLIDNAD